MRLIHCTFCQDRLEPTPPRGVEWLWTVILMRTYMCPHCREGYVRPILTLSKYFGRPRDDVRKSTNTKGWNLGAATGKRSSKSRSSSRSGSSGRSRSKSKSKSKAHQSHSDAPRSRVLDASTPSANDDKPLIVDVPARVEMNGAVAGTELSSDSNTSTVERSRSERSERSDSREEEGRAHRSSSSSRSRVEREREREQRQVKRKDATIASLSSQSRPTSYGSGGLLYRTYRKVRRRTRKLLGLSKRKKSGVSSSKRSY